MMAFNADVRLVFFKIILLLDDHLHYDLDYRNPVTFMFWYSHQLDNSNSDVVMTNTSLFHF